MSDEPIAPPEREAGQPVEKARPGGARTGADQPWDPEDLAEAEGKDPTPKNVRRAEQKLAEEGPSAIDRTVP
jgi:hypothetical protein